MEWINQVLFIDGSTRVMVASLSLLAALVLMKAFAWLLNQLPVPPGRRKLQLRNGGQQDD